MSEIRKSLIISFIEQFSIIFLKLISFVVLARLLTPEDIGLYSVSIAFVGFAYLLRDFGIGSYLIQEKELTQDRIRTAFTITLIISWILFLFLQAIAGVVSDFYEDERMNLLVRLISISFLIIPFNSTTYALIRREMKFSVLLWINISSALMGTSSAVLFAYLGYGHLSLAYSALIAIVTTGVGGFIYRKSEFFMWPTLIEWRRVSSFGSRVTVARMLAQISEGLNDLVIGKVMGFSTVAIIGRAHGMMNIFHESILLSILNVAVPGFAKAHRANADLDAIHTRTVTAITSVAWPFYGFLGIFSFEVLRIMFGDQWDAAAELVPFFSLAGAAGAVWFFVIPLCTSTGRADIELKAQLVMQLMKITLLTIAAVVFLDALIFSAVFLLVAILFLPISYYYKNKAIKTNWPALLGGLFSSFKLTMITLSLPLLLKLLSFYYYIDVSIYTLVFLSASAAAALWLFGVKRTHSNVLDDPVFPEKLRELIHKWV